ncbi:MAG: hypothetical protein V2A76_06115 [Planctomycetota bacterium]
MLNKCGRPGLAGLSFLFLCGLACGQGGPRAVLSLTGSGTLPNETVEDEELVLAAAGTETRLFLPDQTLAFYLGDLNGDGLFDEPEGLDALELVSTAAGEPMTAGLYFSLVSDQGTLLDGDIVRFNPAPPGGGVVIAFAEAFLVSCVAADDGNIDVDAMAFRPDGSLLFSLGEDESTGAGSVVVEDDAVWILPSGATHATVLYSGATINSWVESALGAPASIGDLKALEWYQGELLFTVQSPSADDATIFSSAGGGTVFGGFSEANLGFLNAVEADALALFEEEPFPSLALDVSRAAEGDPILVEMAGLTPQQPFLILAAYAPLASGSSISLPGFGVVTMDPLDPLFQLGLLNAPALMGVADASGRASYGNTAPARYGAPYDLVLQVVDLSNHAISNPAVLEVNQ